MSNSENDLFSAVSKSRNSYSTLESVIVIGSNALTWVIWSSIGGAKIKSQKQNETGQRDWSNVCLFQTHVQSNPFSIDVVELELIVNCKYSLSDRLVGNT